MEQKTDYFFAEDVTDLAIDAGCAQITVEMADGIEQIQVDARTEPDADYRCENTGGKLAISYRWRHMQGGADTAYIALLLPKKKPFKTFVLKLGAGKADLRRSEICCGRLKIETGAGSIQTGGLRVNGTLAVESGAGNVEMESVYAEQAEVSCGVGNFSMNGKIEHDLQLSCGVGACDIRLEGNEQDYDYNVSCGLGKVRVNGNDISGIAGKQKQNNPNAVGKIHISCGLGKVILKVE